MSVSSNLTSGTNSLPRPADSGLGTSNPGEERSTRSWGANK